MSSTLAAASTAASSSSTSSPRCVPFAAFRRRGSTRGRLPASSGDRTVTHSSAPAAAAGGCGRPLCRAAEVLGGGIQSAFFASMDSCACLEVRTNSFKESESEAAALMSPPPPPPHEDSGRAAAVARSGAGRSRASAGGKPRRGLGCCTPNSTTSVN